MHTDALCSRQGERHLPTMTVHETLKFAFDSMAGGTHAEGLGEEDGLTDDQKELISWMDSKHLKVCRYVYHTNPRNCWVLPCVLQCFELAKATHEGE